MRILVVNAGSSSLKLSVLGADDAVIKATTIDRWYGEDEPLREFLTEIGSVDAVGHRVVHGGTAFLGPARIDGDVRARLAALVSLAPLHQPRSLIGIDTARRALPKVPHVACFDTAFHSTMPDAAKTYALPAEWRERWPLRRFGFHGLSHAYASRRAAALVKLPLDELRIVTCHLGAGSSLCAVRYGRSIDTTMGFTPLDGLVMATRAGSIDPGLVLWLLKEGGLSWEAVREGLEERSGLRALSRHADMRELLVARAAAEGDAMLAFDVYTHALRRSLGAMVAVLDGLDVVAFTGGVGEHVPEVRAEANIPLDATANATTTADGEIGALDAGVRAVVITAREDLEIAGQVRQVV